MYYLLNNRVKQSCVCVRQMEGFYIVFNRLMACGKKLRNIKYDAFLKESGVKVKGSVNSH